MRIVWYALAAIFVLAVVAAVLNPVEGKTLSAAGAVPGLLVAAFFFWMGRRASRKKTIASKPADMATVEAAAERIRQEEQLGNAAAPRLVFASSMISANNSDPDASALYKQVFYSHMGTLRGFTQQDIDKVYSMLAGTGEGIGGNAVRYSPEAVLESEFADREWTWPEMDEWEKIFRQEGSFPGGWDYWWNAPDMENLDMPTLCNMLTVDQIREILDSLAVSYPAKSKKADLVALLDEKAKVQDVARVMPEWEEKALERKRGRSKARARELFRLISARAGSRNTAQLLASNGKKTSLVIDNPSDEIYIKKALALNPEAVPPFFPGDRSRY